MIRTSHFELVPKLLIKGESNLISISGEAPLFFKEALSKGELCFREYHKLAPLYSWWKEWHDNQLSNEWYEHKYRKTVLSKLNAFQVVQELGKDSILLCYEQPGTFCHRIIVAKWIYENTGIKVEEYS